MLLRSNCGEPTNQATYNGNVALSLATLDSPLGSEQTRRQAGPKDGAEVAWIGLDDWLDGWMDGWKPRTPRFHKETFVRFVRRSLPERSVRRWKRCGVWTPGSGAGIPREKPSEDAEIEGKRKKIRLLLLLLVDDAIWQKAKASSLASSSPVDRTE